MLQCGLARTSPVGSLRLGDGTSVTYGQHFQILQVLSSDFAFVVKFLPGEKKIGRCTAKLQNRRLGVVKRSEAEPPTGNPSPAPIAIAPHARHDRSMARIRRRLGRSEAYFLPHRNGHEKTSRVPSESLASFRSF